MTNKQKIKGSAFERLAVDILNRLVKKSSWKRIPGSGAIGTILNEPLLMSDITGEMDALPKKFSGEAKVGYGGATQFALKKLWLDKVKQEADANFRVPFLIGKFSGAREGVKVFVVLDVETFAELMNMITDLSDALKEKENGK